MVHEMNSGFKSCDVDVFKLNLIQFFFKSLFPFFTKKRSTCHVSSPEGLDGH